MIHEFDKEAYSYLKSDYAGFFSNYIISEDGQARALFARVDRHNAIARGCAVVTSPLFVLSASTDELYGCLYNTKNAIVQLFSKEFSESMESASDAGKYFAGFVLELVMAALSPFIELISFIGGVGVNIHESCTSSTERNTGPSTINS